MSRQKQVKQIRIDLDEYTSCPHSAVLQVYKDAHAEHMYMRDSPAEINERRVKMASKASKKPIRHVITGIYRRKVGDKEYCFFHEAISSKDYFGNNVMHSRMVGKYELPIINKTFGLNPALIKGSSDINKLMEAQEKEVSIESIEPAYEFEFESLKDQLETWYSKGIIRDDTTHFYAWVGNKKHSKPFTFREFMDLSIDDLVLLSNFAEKLSTAFKTDEINAEMLATLRKTIREELLTVPKTGATQ